MKKYLIFILVLLVPFLVKAKDNVEIKKVELIEKSDYVEILEEPTFEGLKLNFNIEFSYVNDYAKYLVTVTNNSSKDYEIDSTTQFNKGEYIGYYFELEKDTEILKAGETREVVLGIAYVSEVPNDKLVNGKYEEKNNAIIVLKNDDKVVNPYTSSIPIVIIAIAIIALIVLLISQKRKKELIFVLIGISLIPITIYALEKLVLNVSVDVTVKRGCTRLRIDGEGSFSTTEELKEICVTLSEGEDYEYTALSRVKKDGNSPNKSTHTFFSSYINPNDFKDTSYIKIYEDSSKTNLLATIDKEWFGPKRYGLNNGRFTVAVNDNNYVLYDLGEIDPHNLYIEVSDDLLALNIHDWAGPGERDGIIHYSNPLPYDYIFPGDEYVPDLGIRTIISGPWITEQEDIAKMEVYESIVGPLMDPGCSLGLEFEEDETNPYIIYVSPDPQCPIE